MSILSVDKNGAQGKITRLWGVSGGVSTPIAKVYYVTGGASTMVYPDLCTITARSPTSVVRNAGTTITLTGTGFYTATSVTVSSIGNVAVTILSDTALTFKWPTSLLAATLNVTVNNARGTSNATTITCTHPTFYLLNPASAGVWLRPDWDGNVVGTSGGPTITATSSTAYDEESWYSPYFNFGTYNQIYLQASVGASTSSALSTNINQYSAALNYVSPYYSYNAWNTIGYGGAAYLRFGRYGGGVASGIGSSYLYQVILRKTN